MAAGLEDLVVALGFDVVEVTMPVQGFGAISATELARVKDTEGAVRQVVVRDGELVVARTFSREEALAKTAAYVKRRARETRDWPKLVKEPLPPAQLAQRLGCTIRDEEDFEVWGAYAKLGRCVTQSLLRQILVDHARQEAKKFARLARIAKKRLG